MDKTCWMLYQYNHNNEVIDQFEFRTFKEAKEEKEFLEYFFNGEYKFKICEETFKIIYSNY